MGWASASEIFNPVAQALIDLNASPAVKRRVLGTLLSKLRAEDWDTSDESLQAFRHDPTIVQIFYEEDPITLGDWPEGQLGYDPRTNQWTLTCHGGRDACGELDRGDGDSAEEHDRLVHAWVVHACDKHDGDGTVPTWMLLDQPDEDK